MTDPTHQPPPMQHRPYLAHLNENGKSQPLIDHLNSVSCRAAHSAAKIAIAPPGQLVGLVHDLGKTNPPPCTHWRLGNTALIHPALYSSR